MTGFAPRARMRAGQVKPGFDVVEFRGARLGCLRDGKTGHDQPGQHPHPSGPPSLFRNKGGTGISGLLVAMVTHFSLLESYLLYYMPYIVAPAVAHITGLLPASCRMNLRCNVSVLPCNIQPPHRIVMYSDESRAFADKRLKTRANGQRHSAPYTIKGGNCLC